MRGLLVLALLAAPAHADELTAKLVTAVEKAEPECLDLLDQLRARDVPATTEVLVREHYVGRIPQAPRPVVLQRERMYSLRQLRVVCGAQARGRAADAMRMTIEHAAKYPEIWVGACIEQWPKALAKGVRPTEPYATMTLEAAYRRYCSGSDGVNGPT